jgi:antitoxin (DNA-binding transcriptional repressor) of toxin-antitoxin stability system
MREMKTVGLRELKNRLSEYVRDARSGETVLVTDRGQVVAELTMPGKAAFESSGCPSGLLALARDGLLTIGGPNKRELYPQLAAALKQRRAAELLDEERGGR